MCTVGYGDFAPHTDNEQLYVTVCMLISAGIYARTIENVEKILAKHNVLAAQFREHMLYVNQFMKRNSFPLELRSAIWRYLQYQWETKKQIKIEQGEVFGILNFDLQEKITICMNGVILHSISAFNLFTNSLDPECIEFMSRITFHSRIENFAVDEYIFHVRTLPIVCRNEILEPPCTTFCQAE